MNRSESVNDNLNVPQLVNRSTNQSLSLLLVETQRLCGKNPCREYRRVSNRFAHKPLRALLESQDKSKLQLGQRTSVLLLNS